MKSLARTVTVASFLGAALVAGPAAAHIELKSPTARTTDQKTAPCGQLTNARTNKVSVFKPGQTITVTWDETINHPGHFRISFDPNGTNFPNPKSFTDKDGGVNVLVDGIPDKTGTTPIAYSQQVTLPNIECNNCTLQLIQVMTDKPPYNPGPTGNDIYYQCADLVLTNADAGVPPTDGGTTQDSGTKQDSGSTIDSGGPTPDGGDTIPVTSDAGCQCAIAPGRTVAGAAGGLAFSVIAIALLARRRRVR